MMLQVQSGNAPEARSDKMPIALIGAPLELGAGRRGCAMGPAALRTTGLAEALADLGYDVKDRGDLGPSAWPIDRTNAGRSGAPLARGRGLGA